MIEYRVKRYGFGERVPAGSRLAVNHHHGVVGVDKEFSGAVNGAVEFVFGNINARSNFVKVKFSDSKSRRTEGCVS